MDPLTLTKEQRDKLITYLKDKPKGRFNVLYQQGDPEALNVGNNILFLLREIGWEAEWPAAKPAPDTMGDLSFQVRFLSS